MWKSTLLVELSKLGAPFLRGLEAKTNVTFI
jgi:hypothetical protein